MNGHRVVLSFSGAGGMSNDVRTDSSGVAEFQVGGGREGDVFVDGRKVDSWGSSSRTDVTVSI